MMDVNNELLMIANVAGTMVGMNPNILPYQVMRQVGFIQGMAEEHKVDSRNLITEFSQAAIQVLQGQILAETAQDKRINHDQFLINLMSRFKEQSGQ